MGRGQTRVGDHFSAIFGNRRGRGEEDVQVFASPKDALRPPFASGTIDFNRRVALTQRLVEEFGTGIFRAGDIQETYMSIYTQSHSSLAAFQMEGTDLRDACIMDLDSLVFQGLCIKDEPHQLRLHASGETQYRLKDMFLWPKAHWISFTSAIQGVSAPFSTNAIVAGRMLTLLHEWMPGSAPRKEEEIVKIHQDAYPSVSRKEAQNDLEELTRQGLCVREASEGSSSVYSLLPTERWSSEHRQALAATTYPW